MLDKSHSPKKPGSLTVVGTGIAASQITIEARSSIQLADKVLYCVADAATERLIKRINPNSESLYVFYGDDKPRALTYEQMVQRTLECVREPSDVCMVFYGHPGIFVHPSHEAIKRAREEGFEARMLPAVSSLDCLYGDLGIDPARGCQMVEATDLLLRDRMIDTSTHVIVWQIGCVGDLGFKFKGYDGRNVPVLAEALSNLYGGDYEAVVYEAAQYNICEPVIRKTKLKDLANANLTGISTLYIPPKERSVVNPAMAQRLGIQLVFERMAAKSEREPVASSPG